MFDPYDELRAEARRSFRAFYTVATPHDAPLLDSLVIAYVTLRQATNIPRELIPAQERTVIERDCNEVEQRFMIACERVQQCATFRKLVPGDQRRIKAILFDFNAPTLLD